MWRGISLVGLVSIYIDKFKILSKKDTYGYAMAPVFWVEIKNVFKDGSENKGGMRWY